MEFIASEIADRKQVVQWERKVISHIVKGKNMNGACIGEHKLKGAIRI